MTTQVKQLTAIALAPALLLPGCATLPDLSGYTAATTEVRSSVSAVGGAVQSEIDSAGTAMGGSAGQQVKADARRFETAWSKTVGAMNAMVNYAESIEAIASAGNKGEESAQAVVAQVKGLVDTVGIALGPAAGILNVVTSTGATIYGEYAKMEGARKLDAALAASGPIIRTVQDLVAKQIDEARIVFDDSVSAQLMILASSDLYGDDLSADKTLRENQRRFVVRLNSLLGATPPRAAEIATLQSELKALSDARAALTPRLTEYEAKRTAIETRHKAGIALLGASKDAVTAWGSAHTRLAAAVRNHQPVTLASLTAAAADVKALITQWREL